MRYILRILFIFLIASFAYFNSNAQDDSTELIFIVENMPLFENGDPSVSFRTYIQNKIVDIEKDIPDSASGRIIIQFLVDTTGFVVDPKIIEGLGEELDSIACQIVLDSPKWSPGTQRDKPVKVLFTFPIYINMEDPVHNQDNINTKKERRKSRRNTASNSNLIL